MQTICIMMSVCGALSSRRALRHVQKYVTCHVSVHPGVAVEKQRYTWPVFSTGACCCSLKLRRELPAHETAQQRTKPQAPFCGRDAAATRSRDAEPCKHGTATAAAAAAGRCGGPCSASYRCGRDGAGWQGGRAAHRVKADLRAVGTPFSGSSFQVPLVLNLVTSST